MKTLTRTLLCTLLLSAPAHAQCPVHTIILKGHIDNPAPNSLVRVQLSYPKQLSGESAETTLQDGSFRLPIEFLTQSTRPFLRNLKPKCDRKPNVVIVTLLSGNQETSQITLDFPRDFTMADASAYTPSSEIVLKNTQYKRRPLCGRL
jgi:hypothetical protein